MEGEGIGALGHFHQGLIICAFGSIVLTQLCTETARLDADHGVHVGVEVLLAAENLSCDLVLLWGTSGVLNRIIGEISQKLAEGLRAMQSMAAEKFLDLGEMLGFLSHGAPAGDCNTNVTRYACLCEIIIYLV
jgi:hypothetical protein